MGVIAFFRNVLFPPEVVRGFPGRTGSILICEGHKALKRMPCWVSMAWTSPCRSSMSGKRALGEGPRRFSAARSIDRSSLHASVTDDVIGMGEEEFLVSYFDS
jgi:hypothetical protein